jgi:hypothetical protein
MDAHRRRAWFKREFERRADLFSRDPGALERALRDPRVRYYYDELGRRIAAFEAERKAMKQVYEIEARALLAAEREEPL